MIRSLFPLGLTCLLLAACAGTASTIQHFQLGAAASPATENSGPQVHVGQLTLPDYLLRNDLVFRRNEFSLHYDSMQRWAEPLDIGARRVIGEQLGAALGGSTVTVFPAPAAPQTQWVLDVEFQRFEAVEKRAVLTAKGIWRAAGGDARETRSLSFDESLPLADLHGDEVARALSDLLVRFSAQLVAALD